MYSYLLIASGYYIGKHNSIKRILKDIETLGLKSDLDLHCGRMCHDPSKHETFHSMLIIFIHNLYFHLLPFPILHCIKNTSSFRSHIN
jgi:hypothetical protein